MTTPAPLQTPRTGVLILAAGAGLRLGGRAKCLLKIQGQSLLERLVHSLHSLDLSPVLVLGHHAAEIQTHLARWPAQWVPPQVINPEPTDDPATSLHAGLHALDDDTQTVMVLLADQPLMDANDIAEVLVAFQHRPAHCRVLAPLVDGVPGHPVVFDGSVRADLLATPGSSLRQWRTANPQATLKWVVDNPHYTRDLDTVNDLELLVRDTGWTISWPA